MSNQKKIDADDLRHRAEQAVQLQVLNSDVPKSTHEIERLLYELQVHQVELEMQNEELRNLQAELEELRTHYTDIYYFSPVNYFTLKHPTIIVQVNLAGSRLLGGEGCNLIGRHLSDFIVETDRSVFSACIRQVFMGETGKTCEVRLLRKDQTVAVVRIQASFFANTQECRVVATDITDIMNERKKTEQALLMVKKMTEIAEIANHTKSRFLANIGHEIRTPLNGVLGFAQLLNLSSLNEDQQYYVEQILIIGQHLLALIEEILDLSKIEANQLVLEQEPFDLPDLLNSLKKMFITKANENHLRLNFIRDDNISVELIGDALRLKQILINLLDNALKFTKKGSVEVRTQVVSYLDDNHVLVKFSITDTGIGIAQGKMGDVFLPFTQIDSSTTREFGGIGLGLSISRMLVELLGAELQVESELGVGSCFYFSVPFEINLQPYSGSAAKKLDSIAQSKSVTGPHLLIVEDDEASRILLRHILTEEKISCDEAENGLQALQLLKRNHYDAVLMGGQMPVMDGIETTKKIRQSDENYKDIPIIATTTCVFSGDKERFLQAGINAYIPKPLQIESFLVVLNEVLSLRKRFPANEG